MLRKSRSGMYYDVVDYVAGFVLGFILLVCSVQALTTAAVVDFVPFVLFAGLWLLLSFYIVVAMFLLTIADVKKYHMQRTHE